MTNDIEALIGELKEASAHEVSDYKSNLYRQCRIALRQLSEERDGWKNKYSYAEYHHEKYGSWPSECTAEKTAQARAKLKGQDDEE